ncbi:hypothetical protein LCGC14_2170140 [marine sediment metagenome]|uniref:Uncharacterized protein n=1 Tax=marine sediment metagenome TaxID=412755 RepID=A0A0F9DQ53_9ZZZZ
MFPNPRISVPRSSRTYVAPKCGALHWGDGHKRGVRVRDRKCTAVKRRAIRLRRVVGASGPARVRGELIVDRLSSPRSA